MFRSCRFFVLFFVSVSSFAEPAPEGILEETRSSISDFLALEYANTLSGPSLTAPFSGQNYNDETRDHTGILELENSIYVGYKLNPDLVVGPVVRWLVYPGEAGGVAFDLKDPYLRLRHVKFISSGVFNIEADLRLSAPTSQQSRDNGLVTSLASEQIVSYDLSPVVFELTTFVQHNFFGNEGNQEGEHWELHAAPGVRYRLSDSVQMKAVYETGYTQARIADLAPRHEEGSLVEVGVVWDITTNLRFNPSIHTRTSRPLSGDSFTIGAKLDWILL